MSADPGWVVSCEHAGRRVPARYRALFAGARDVLDTHRGWDPGAAPLARAVARAVGRPAPLLHPVTRLLVDVNRSPGHPRCFSEFSGRLPPDERRRLLERVHGPHRERVREAIRAEIGRHGACVHVGVHTFTPRLGGVERPIDVGLLYDPARVWERELCARWQTILREGAPGWRVRRNAPYRGIADGLTTALRGTFPAERYAGIELEVGQAMLATPGATRAVAERLAGLAGPLREAARETRPGG